MFLAWPRRKMSRNAEAKQKRARCSTNPNASPNAQNIANSLSRPLATTYTIPATTHAANAIKAFLGRGRPAAFGAPSAVIGSTPCAPILPGSVVQPNAGETRLSQHDISVGSPHSGGTVGHDLARLGDSDPC